jgi:predicted transcriptional regulator
LSTKSEPKSQQLQWRRSKVIELRSRGLSQLEIARELQISEASVSSDVQYLCEQAKGTIKEYRFLHHDKKTVASTVNFVNRNFANIKDGIVLMVQAQEYINVSPTERSHWEQYEIPESQIKFKLELTMVTN